jgi:hypothetical protein
MDIVVVNLLGKIKGIIGPTVKRRTLIFSGIVVIQPVVVGFYIMHLTTKVGILPYTDGKSSIQLKPVTSPCERKPIVIYSLDRT